MAIDPVGGPCPTCEAQSTNAWWRNKLVLVFWLYALIFLAGHYWAGLQPLVNNLLMYLQTIALPVVVGLLIGGVIDWVVPREYISLILAQKKKRTILLAVLTGFLMSACSHGILALTIQLYKKGASTPAVVAFLLASPWANLPLTILMFGFFGVKALLIVGGAVIIALISGYIFMLLEGGNLVEHNPHTVTVAKDFSLVSDLKLRLKEGKVSPASAKRAGLAIAEGSLALADMVLWWILLGMLLASLAAAYLPVGFMHQYMGPTLIGLLVTLLLATVIEICSEGSAPLAFEIYRQTGALGNSFTFLMAGVVTDYTEIGLLWANVGWRTAVWLLVVTVPQVLLLSLLFNWVF